MLGEDAGSTEGKLAAWRGRVDWSYLRPHYQNGALFHVDPSLDLETVGAAFAEDRRDQVEGWLRGGELVKIEALHAAQWEAGAAEFEALVVSPFVLCRLVRAEASQA